MNPRWLLVPAVAAALAAGVYHRHALGAVSHRDAEAQRVRAASAALAQKADDLARLLEVMRAGASAREASQAERTPALPSAATSESASAARSSPTFAANAAELRPLQVQAYVSEQRLRFAGLLNRLGFTPEKLRAFDRIHAAFREVTLDPAPSTVARQQATLARDAALQELFGASFEQWQEANRAEPARAVVNQIVQQTFPSSGALTVAQADALTEIVSQHRLASSSDPRVAHLRYDWDAIVDRAAAILPEAQMKDVITAIELRRASERMSALAAKKNP